MDIATISVLVSLLVLVPTLLVGVNIGVALMMAGVVGTVVFTENLGIGIALPFLQTVDIASSHPLIVIPLFILMGTLATQSGITTDLFRAFYVWFGRMPGGVAVATIGTCAGMGAITGSSVAVAGAMSKIALPELERYRYRTDLAVGAVAVGGTLAIMIPPSVTFVIFAIFANASIGKLLIAGILPGLVLTVGYVALIVIRCSLNPEIGPRAPGTSLEERLAVLPGVLPFLMIVVIVLGGILTGFWTPVESAAVGVILVFLLGLSRKQFNVRNVGDALSEAIVSTAAIFLVVIGSLVFGTFLALAGVSEAFANAIVSWELSPLGLFMLLMIMYLVLGSFMEVTSILALTIPLVMPLVLKAGWDPVWFGVVVVSMMEVAAVTPPVGLNLYAVKSAAPSVPLQTIYLGAIPFWCVNLLLIVLLYMMPQIALYLPGKM